MAQTAQDKDRTLYDRIIAQLGSGHSVAEAMQKNRERGKIFPSHARTLRRAQMTLHRWAEEECNGTIERDEFSGIPQRRPANDYQRLAGWPIPDREAGALRRVAEVCKAAGLHYYHQTDPRGCALYVSAEPLTDQNYSTRGIACL